jgi:hypothetical protein
MIKRIREINFMNPLPEGALTAIALVVLIILTLNLGLWAAWRRKDNRQQSDWLRRLSQSVRNPWQKDDQMMQDLSDQLDRLKENEINQAGRQKPSDN